MLSLLTPALAGATPPTAAAPHARAAPGASGDAAAQDFAQALDLAVMAEPKATAQKRSRGAAWPPSMGKPAGKTSQTAGKEQQQLAFATVSAPAQAERQADARASPQVERESGLPVPPQPQDRADLQMPLQVEHDSDPQWPPQPEGRNDLPLPPPPAGMSALQLPPQRQGEGKGEHEDRRAGRPTATEAVDSLLSQLRAAPVAAPLDTPLDAPLAAPLAAPLDAPVDAPLGAPLETSLAASFAASFAAPLAMPLAVPATNAAGATAQPSQPAQSRTAGRHPIGTIPSGAARAQDQDALAIAPLPSQRDETVGAERGRDLAAQNLAINLPAEPSGARAETLAVPAPPSPLASSAAASTTQPAQAQAQLSATPGSNEFGAQLGAQISTFVRAGVQHARLLLNPAEMGPVMVQIQVDGQTALVHLSAEHAHTCAALEAAMPQLASGLREAGLTLTGGGVFQQPQQGRDVPAHGSATTRGQGVDPGDEGLQRSAAAAVPRRRGVVDLVA